jgi:hypothetical protein
VASVLGDDALKVSSGNDIGGEVVSEDVRQLGWGREAVRRLDAACLARSHGLSDDGLGLLLDGDGVMDQIDVPAFERRQFAGERCSVLPISTFQRLIAR